MNSAILPLVAVAVVAIGCMNKPDAVPDAADSAITAAPALPPGEGMLPVPDGQVWYRKVGSGGGTPVILLHGGPGYSSYYLKLFEKLGDDRPVVRYDQRQASLVPGAKVEVLKGAAHVTPWDAPDQNLAVVREFLRATERSPK